MISYDLQPSIPESYLFFKNTSKNNNLPCILSISTPPVTTCLSLLFLVLFIDPAASHCVYRSKFTTHFHDFTSTFPFPNVMQSSFKINNFTFDYTPPRAKCFSHNHVICLDPLRLPIQFHHSPHDFFYNTSMTSSDENSLKQ